MPPSGGSRSGSLQSAADAAEQLLAARILRLQGLVADAGDSLEEFGDGLTGGERKKESPTSQPNSAANTAIESITGVVNLLGTKILTVLAPLALMGAAVSSLTSGFGPFLSTVKLAGTLLGTLLTPLFVVAGAAMLALVSVVNDQLMPVLEEWYTVIIGTAITAVQALSKVFDDVVTVGKALWDVLRGMADWIGKQFGSGEGSTLNKAAGYTKEVDILGAGADYFKTQAKGKDLDAKQAEIDKRRADKPLVLPKLKLDENGVPLPDQAPAPTPAPAVSPKVETAPAPLPPPVLPSAGGAKDLDDKLFDLAKQKADRTGGNLPLPTAPVLPQLPSLPPAPKNGPGVVVAPAPLPPADKPTDPTKPAPGIALPRSPEPAKQTTGQQFFGEFMTGIKTMTQEIRISQGPRAQSSGIVDAAKQAQLAALNVSPVEAKSLEIQGKQLLALESAVSKLDTLVSRPTGLSE